jgi:hypothetical protein
MVAFGSLLVLVKSSNLDGRGAGWLSAALSVLSCGRPC